jgi:hypothetical protein
MGRLYSRPRLGWQFDPAAMSLAAHNRSLRQQIREVWTSKNEETEAILNVLGILSIVHAVAQYPEKLLIRIATFRYPLDHFHRLFGCTRVNSSR